MAKLLGDVIREARESAGLTQAALARMVDVAPNHLSRLESSDKQSPRFETVARIAKALNLSLDEIAAECGLRSWKVPANPTLVSKRLARGLRALQQELDHASEVLAERIEALEGSRKTTRIKR